MVLTISAMTEILVCLFVFTDCPQNFWFRVEVETNRTHFPSNEANDERK